MRTLMQTIALFFINLFTRKTPMPVQQSAPVPDETAVPVPVPEAPNLAPHVSFIEKWAKCIQTYEGFAPGTRAFNNSNPGNMRCVPIMNRYAVGKDPQGFCRFSNYTIGFKALCEKLRLDASGESETYNAMAKQLFGLDSAADCTMYQFFQIYAPTGDDNNPKLYSDFVTKNMGISPNTKIKDLL